MGGVQWRKSGQMTDDSSVDKGELDYESVGQTVSVGRRQRQSVKVWDREGQQGHRKE